MLELYDQIQAACETIRQTWDKTPSAGIILGTGLGNLVEEIQVEASFDYEQIPHFIKATALGHQGKLVCGMLQDQPIVAMQGRFHHYEGYSMKQITFPVRVMKALGCQLLIATNATGGLNPYYAPGDIMLIDDHINLMWGNPLIGINDERLGPRFPDMCEPYDQKLIQLAEKLALEHQVPLHKGVLVSVTGPNFETRAEYRFLRNIGADVVGMSVIPEVIVAVHSGLKTVAFSVVTDMCLPDALEPADPHQIIKVSKIAEPKLRTLVNGLLAQDSHWKS